MTQETNELLYRKMFEEIEDYAIVLLDSEGNIENWNKGAQLMKGYTFSEIAGKHFSLFYSENDRAAQKPEKLVAETVRAGSAKQEGWRFRKDGSCFWAEVLLTAIHDDLGGVIGFTQTIRDLVDQRLADEAMRQRIEELNTVHRELEQFLYIASHDLQEPLLTITNFIDLIRTEHAAQLCDKADMYLDCIVGASERLRKLIRQLLDYSRIGKIKTATLVDMNRLLDRVQQELSTDINATHTEIRYQHLPAVQGYEFELMQLFYNLLGNAIKFKKTDCLPIITITAENQGNQWLFRVKDNGIGIEPQYNDRIFMIFQRLHNRNEYEGSGIGLAYCKKIVELHGGKIYVEAMPGEGSTFYLTLNTSLEER